MRALVGTAALFGAVVLGAGAYYIVRNPERAALDAGARRGVGGRFLRLTDGVTRYDVSGRADGPLVVLVHGFSVPYYVWDPTVTALTAAGFRVLRYDLYGRGYSDRPALDYTADVFDRQLTDLLAAIGVDGAVDVVGMSMGGWVSATFVGRHPERARSLTLIDPVAERPRLPSIMRVPVLGPALWQAVFVPGLAERQREDFVEPARFPDWAARYRPQMTYRGFGRALLSTALALAAADFDAVYARVGRLDLPVALIWGREDTTVPYAPSERVRRAIPQARFHTIDRAGHLPHVERADVVNPLLLEFLRRSAGRSATGRPAA
jgi:pimeloyl-ACP methyl ester carboxylesterase